jgi:hypothetical protein
MTRARAARQSRAAACASARLIHEPRHSSEAWRPTPVACLVSRRSGVAPLARTCCGGRSGFPAPFGKQEAIGPADTHPGATRAAGRRIRPAGRDQYGGTRLRVSRPTTSEKNVAPMIAQTSGNRNPPMSNAINSGSSSAAPNHAPTSASIRPTAEETRHPPGE